MVSRRFDKYKNDVDEDIDNDEGFEDGFEDGFSSTPSSSSKPAPTAASSNNLLADDWLLGLAQALDPGKTEEKHIWTPQPGPQTKAFYSDADELFYGGAAGGGKAVWVHNILITNNGWKEMGDIVAGDILFDENGIPTTVLIAHPIEEKTDSYRLEFDDGSVIYADARHLWLTYDAKELAALTRRDPQWRENRRKNRPSRVTGNKSDRFTNSIIERNKRNPTKDLPPPTGTVRTTKEIADTLTVRGGRRNHAIPVAKALSLPDIDLPLDPYVLGAWLGDGTKTGGAFTGIDPEIWEEIEKAGFTVTHNPKESKRHNINGISKHLEQAGVLNNKHIPSIYLRASASQRLALLQGLMDTDGTVYKTGASEFTNTNKAIVDGVYELIVSLGWKARVVESRARLNGEDYGPVWNIKWTPDDYVFRLPRKREKQKLAQRRTTKFRYIVSCDPVDPMPMRCLTVDSPNHLFLVGESMIPTHNCLTLDHEVMTQREGWKPITAVKTGERVASLSDSGSIVWGSVSETIAEPHRGKLYVYDDDRISFRATPNHKLVINNGEEPVLIPVEIISQYNYPFRLYDGSGNDIAFDPLKLKIEDYTGDVFCLNVYPYHNFVIRHNGKIHVTGNSDLMLGLALSDLSPHKKAIIFRRSYPELKDIVTRAKDILSNTDAVFRGGNAMRFDNLPYGKSLELGSVPTFAAAQKYKGRPHDLKLFDELSDIGESVYTFLIGWARTAEPGVPVRVVSAGNPPTNSDGEWVIRRWGPWLDKNHSNPALPGELRWYATLDGEDREITPEFNEAGSRGEEFEYVNKIGDVERIKPKSRTFIPARLDDNAYLRDTDYRSILQNMPEPYRSQLLYGDFTSAQKDDPWQVVPTEWVRLSQKRWLEASENGELQRHERDNPAFGVDVAEGGTDYTVITMLTGKHLQWIEYIKEEDTMKQIEILTQKMKLNKRSPIGVDAIGVGLGMAQRLGQMGFSVASIKVSRESRTKDVTGNFTFANLRSELWWRLREAFDPDGDICLNVPPDKRLFGDLIAPRYTVVGNGVIRVERQDQIRAKIGRSPDAANSLMFALYVQRKRSVPLRMA